MSIWPSNIFAFGIWPMPRNMALVGQVPNFVGFQIPQLETGDFFLVYVVNFFDHGIGEKFNLLVLAARGPA